MLIWENQRPDDPFSGAWVCEACGEVCNHMFGSSALVSHRCLDKVIYDEASRPDDVYVVTLPEPSEVPRNRYERRRFDRTGKRS